MRRTIVTVGAVVLTLSGSASDWRSKAAHPQSQSELRKPFIGTWRLVSITGGNSPGNRGPNPTGIIMYDAHGNMAVQIMPDRPRPKYTAPPTPEQALEAIRGYVAYFGTYTIDEKAGTVTHHRQGMLDSGAVDFVRKFQLTPDGNRITLIPVGPGTPIHLTWERVK
jgi:hypothetical protein